MPANPLGPCERDTLISRVTDSRCPGVTCVDDPSRRCGGLDAGGRGASRLLPATHRHARIDQKEECGPGMSRCRILFNAGRPGWNVSGRFALKLFVRLRLPARRIRVLAIAL